MMTVKDWRGNEIKVGSKIIWPGRSGSSMWMTEGEVVDIEIKKDSRWNGTQIEEFEVPVLKVKSLGTTNFWKNQTDKISTIHVISRVTVLPDVVVPQKQENKTFEVPVMAPFNNPVDPEGIPHFAPSFSSPNITWTVEASIEELPPAPTVKESLEAIKILVDKLPSMERKQLTRDLIRKSINLNLKDFKDI